jgi:hypothetical protein
LEDMNFSVTGCSLKFRLDRQMEFYFFWHVDVEIHGRVEYKSCSNRNFVTTNQNLASFNNQAASYEFYTAECLAVFSGNCAWRGRFSHDSSCLCLYWQDYGYVANLHCKFFRWWDRHAEIPMGLVTLVVAICSHHLPHRT